MPTVPATAVSRSFTEHVAAEVRAQLARQRVTGRELGRRLVTSPQWVSQRLQGRIAMSTEDLERIAEAIGVPVLSLVGVSAATPAPTTPPDPFQGSRSVQEKVTRRGRGEKANNGR